MSVMLATLCLNEMEHLPLLYAQHRNWPKMTKWVFIESADIVYARTNPHMVTKDGLSVDGTSEWLTQLAKSDPRITYIPYGICDNPDPAQGKVQARQQYMIVAEEVQPQFIMVVDADEFYTHAHQNQIILTMATAGRQWNSFRFRQREIWRPPSIADQKLLQYEVQGGFWSIPHCRGWRFWPGVKYGKNHNWLEDKQGRLLSNSMYKLDAFRSNHPQCVHLAFASSLKARSAKHRYYEARGEGPADGRQTYIESRAAYETWTPGTELPHGARIVRYNGPIPECFQ